jgi:hypothetical protein
LTGRDDLNEHISSFDAFIKPLKDKRIVRVANEKDFDSNLPNITIMPSIQEVVNEEFANGVIEQIALANTEKGEAE